MQCYAANNKTQHKFYEGGIILKNWFNDAVVYEIYPQSFYDTNGDGIGDLQGIIQKLDYIKDMGFTAIWLNPINESSFRDAGYDVNDIDNVLTEFDNAIGLPYLKVIHLNDSKNGMKSHKDRHENLGYGQIGFNTLLKWAWHPLTNHVIKILETPAVNGIMPYKEEVYEFLKQQGL